MCMSVYHKHKVYHSVGELKALVGGGNMVPDPGCDPQDSNCLCSVDLAETAWNFNCRAWTDGVEVEFVPFGKDPEWGDRLMERRSQQAARAVLEGKR